MTDDPPAGLAGFLRGELEPPTRLERPGPEGDPDSTRVGRYEILGLLGKGGMGNVYLAWDPEAGREVALKVLRGAGNEPALARFAREATIAAGLDHPSIVRVLDVGRAGRFPYLAMEVVEGPTLAEEMKRAGGADRIRLMARIADALAALHAAGIIHRDLKPANVLIAADGRPLVTDFGLARRLDAETILTATGTVLGTLWYMSPEQLEGQRDAIDRRTDVWAAGVILYEMLTGRRPFDGATGMEVRSRILNAPLVPPTTHDATIPTDLEAICLRCLRRDRFERYPDGGGLRDDLVRFLEGEPVTTRRWPDPTPSRGGFAT